MSVTAERSAAGNLITIIAVGANGRKMKMTREEIEKSLRICVRKSGCAGCSFKTGTLSLPGCLDNLLSAVADMLEKDAPGWISVKDRLPNDDERVLAYFPEMRDSEADIQLSKGWAINKFVSHWMPLPKTPKEAMTNDA